ncbi:hypothetical protein J4P02_11165 [Pseudomonas sp. NFXW11]|uniref:hypothetical protein n=1 Tax=Pseudomonas sp. NFXW11 TaxID=2819531 RepID=UPI003CEB58F3
MDAEEIDVMPDPKTKRPGQELVALAEVESARKLLLASTAFKKSPRMSRLLNYLVEQALQDSARDTSEYAIGIGVFDKDPLAYSTGDDPIVRVQVGRLRTKLKNYYASAQCNARVEIVIPLGCYMPVFRYKPSSPHTVQQSAGFSICPFKCVSQQVPWEYFTQGLNAELTHQLYKNLGRKIFVEPATISDRHDSPGKTLEAVFPAAVGHRLEGSVHVDAHCIRTSVRLIDPLTGCVVWSEQFQRTANITLAHPQELAAAICQALHSFLRINESNFREKTLPEASIKHEQQCK